jgi:cyclase
MMRIGSVMVFGTMVNAGVIAKGGEALVVDTMFPALAMEMKQAIESEKSRTRYIFNTHYHSDHTFGNCVFSAPAIANKRDARTMQNNLAGQWSKESLEKWASQNPGTPDGFTVKAPEIAFSDSLEVKLERISAVGEVFGGHTPGSSILAVEEEGVLFAGDMLFIGRHPYTGDGNMTQWAQSLRRLLPRARQMKAVVPGHGRVLTGEDINTEITRLIDYFESTLDAVSNLISRGVSRNDAPFQERLPVLSTLSPTPEDRRVGYIQRVYDEVCGK